MKHIHPVRLIIYITLTTLLVALISCSPVKKGTTSKETSTTTDYKSKYDSLTEVLQQTTLFYQTIIDEQSKTGVLFETDTVKHLSPPVSYPNKVVIAPDGTIIAEGNIKSASAIKKKSEQQSINWQARYDSLSRVSKLADNKTETKTVEKQKIIEKAGLFTWWWLWLIVGASATVGVQKIKKLLPI